MWLKQQGFNLSIPPQAAALFVMNGQEIFLVEAFKQQFKKAWLASRKDSESAEYQRIDVNQPQDWQQLSAAFGNYSLFSSLTILDVFYDKKSIDKEGKNFLSEYLNQADPSCLLLLHLPQLTTTALKFLADDKRAHLVAIKTPDQNTVLRWITQELSQQFKTYTKTIPQVIYQYTQGNLLACSQVLQKLQLAETNTEQLTQETVLDHLHQQSSYQIYELSDACLAGNTERALLILRHALDNRQEPTFILWIIAQEIRLLIQLNELQQTNTPWQAALTQLKIWSSRGSFYQSALKRLSADTLRVLLTRCRTLDRTIKTSQTNQLQSTIELLILSLCQGKDMSPIE